MVRCGFVCCCMFDWLVGFHNLICWLIFAFLISWMDIYDFCGLSGYLEHQHRLIWGSGSFPFGGEFVLWWAEVNSFGYHWFCKPFWLVIWDEVILLGFHLMVLHFDVAFAVEVVLDITKGWRNVWLNPKISPFFVSFGIDCNVVGFFLSECCMAQRREYLSTIRDYNLLVARNCLLYLNLLYFSFLVVGRRTVSRTFNLIG